jgi:hypothetical protein
MLSYLSTQFFYFGLCLRHFDARVKVRVQVRVRSRASVRVKVRRFVGRNFNGSLVLVRQQTCPEPYPELYPEPYPTLNPILVPTLNPTLRLVPWTFQLGLGLGLGLG